MGTTVTFTNGELSAVISALEAWNSSQARFALAAIANDNHHLDELITERIKSMNERMFNNGI